MHVPPRLQTALLGIALACAGCAEAPATPSDNPGVTLRGRHFGVEIATTPAAQAHGLMERTSMPADHGMLFVFKHSAPRVFWMKNTLIPLDILFFDATHKLVSVVSDAPPCRANPCPLYPSDAPARYVLELNAGTAARLGVRQGDVFTFTGELSGSQ
jgi:uncharacterized protein